MNHPFMRQFIFLFFGITLALAQEKPTAPGVPKAVLDPISPTVAGPEEPDLPSGPGFPIDVNNYENPLLLFQGTGKELPMAEELNPDLLHRSHHT